MFHRAGYHRLYVPSGRLMARLAGWLMARLAGRLMARLAGRLMARLAGRLMARLAALQSAPQQPRVSQDRAMPANSPFVR